MTLHDSTYQYLKPTHDQMRAMEALRAAAAIYSGVLETLLPDGDDKDHVLRLHRTTAMWANVVVTRFPDGTPRP